MSKSFKDVMAQIGDPGGGTGKLTKAYWMLPQKHVAVASWFLEYPSRAGLASGMNG